MWFLTRCFMTKKKTSCSIGMFRSQVSSSVKHTAILFVPDHHTYPQPSTSLFFHFCCCHCHFCRSLRIRWTSWSHWSLCWSSTRWMRRSSPSLKRKSETCQRCWQASRRSLEPTTTTSSISEFCAWTAGSAAAWANSVSCECKCKFEVFSIFTCSSSSSSTCQKVGGWVPDSSRLHLEVSLGKILSPKLLLCVSLWVCSCVCVCNVSNKQDGTSHGSPYFRCMDMYVNGWMQI